MSKLRYSALWMVLAMGAAAPQLAAAQTQPTTFMPIVSSDSITITHWYKRKIYNQSSQPIAEIDDVLTNRQGQIEFFILGVGGFLGIGEKHVAVFFNAVQFNTRENDKWSLVMNTTADALKAAPGLTYDGSNAVWVPAKVATQAQTTDPGVELAFMPRTVTVTLLDEGGKYVAIDLKHIPQGGTCQMDKDDTIVRVGAGAGPGTTRVRAAAVQTSPGGCPFLTTFDLPDADYGAARALFVQMKDDAWKKVDEIKKDLGEKWDEVTGKKK
jgi:multidrug efflux pump subunit AcrB